VRRKLALLLALATGHAASAHDFWIEPSTFRPASGARVAATLRVGQNLDGEALPLLPPLVDRFEVVGKGPAGELDENPGGDPAGWARIDGPGLHWIAYQSLPYPLVLPAAKFENEYLRVEGLESIVEARARNGESAAPGRERFYRCAKALLETPGAGPGAFDNPLGLTLEIVPKKNPYTLKPGSTLPLSLLFRGKPLAGALVVAMEKGDPKKSVSARTDAKGFVSLPIARSGFWLVKAVHMEPAPADAGVDWESWWASITFELAAR
jgi:hypothetical protein